MPLSGANLLLYWRDCLADDSIAGIAFDNVRDCPQLAADEARRGEATATVIAKIAELVAQDRRGNGGQNSFDVVLAMGRLSPSYAHGKAGSDFGTAVPLWIPATMHDDGGIWPHETRHPFIARRCLEPSPAAAVSVGLLDDADAYYEEHVPLGGWKADWDAAFTWALELWRAVADKDFFEYDPSDLNFRREFWLVPADIGIDTSKLINCLAEAASDGAGSQSILIRGLVNSAAPLTSVTFSPCSRTGHAGKHPLSEDQRQALDHIVGTGMGEIQAINGPPGTGKTTLIRSAIATTVVDAALNTQDPLTAEPPIIVVTSTNNNAVTNVLDSFVAEDRGGYKRRWIDGLGNCGAYLASGSVNQEKLDTYPTWLARGGSIRAFVDGAKVKELTKLYLSHYNGAFSADVSGLDAALTALHEHLLQHRSRLTEAYTAWYEYRAVAVPNEREADDDMRGRHLDEEVELDFEVEQVRARVAIAEREYVDDIPHLRHALGELQAKNIFEILLSWIPATKRRIYHRFELAYGHGAPTFGDFESIEKEVRLRIEAIVARRKRSLEDLEHIEKRRTALLEKHAEEIARFRTICQRWAKSWSDIRDDEASHVEHYEATYDDLERGLDRGIRRDSFDLACRFWEGRWLAEMVREQPQFWKGELEAKVLMRYRSIAKIYPFYAVTLHSLAYRFDHFAGKSLPLLNQIDLLIVDEAGQVPPHLGGVGLTLAKRAIIIGDVDQLEPIVNLDESLSIENLKHRFGDVDIAEFHRRGLLVHQEGGTLMSVAQYATKYSLPKARVQGSFLSTHYRCVPEIITYCDELIYHGLKAVRESLADPLFPSMGYAHIRGRSEGRGKSRINESEARLIADFIASNATAIVSAYERQVEDIPTNQRLAALVAVVTPYAAQARRIEAVLRTRLPNQQIPIVGTAFAMQGAQAKIVIYSNVYSRGDRMGYANGKRNLLNVAVSRAEDYFLFFGDVGVIQDQAPSTPLRVLADFLVGTQERREANLIPGVPPAFYGDAALVEHIDTPEKHYRLLDEAMRNSREILLISSPFLGEAAKEDGILEGLTSAAGRGVDVRIYSDTKFAEHKMTLGEHLASSGATWRYVDRVHAKTLAVDSVMLYEGSFNWFGASRDPDLRRHEAGWVVRGPYAAQAITEVREYFSQRAKSG